MQMHSNNPHSETIISPRLKHSLRKPPLSQAKTNIHTKLKLLSITSKPTTKSYQISLNSKNQAKTRNFSLTKPLSFNISEENILKTPSTVNENPPMDLEMLNDSLSNYYQNELNRSSGLNNSITPAPCTNFKVNRVKVEKRSNTPMIRYKNEESYIVPLIKRDPYKEKSRKNYSPKRKVVNKVCKIRFFSRRERKTRSPESRRTVFHYFN